MTRLRNTSNVSVRSDQAPFQRTKPPSLVIAAPADGKTASPHGLPEDAGWPLSVDDAEALLARLRIDCPDLFNMQGAGNTLRGIDVYAPSALPRVFAKAVEIFNRAHGRLPDLKSMPTTADHFFAMKFFHPIPIDPNPADKLDAREFLTGPLRRRVVVPRVVHILDRPVLPEPDAIRPGVYWLKVSNGNSMQRRFRWPPPPQVRERLEREAREWLSVRYGVQWGEWWYGLTDPRLFLERDVSPLIANRPEIKVFVRSGRVTFFYAIRHHRNGWHEKAYFDEAHRPMHGGYGRYRPMQCNLPDTIDTMLEAAAVIGRRFSVARVDFLDVGGDKPCLGEVSICHNNARCLFSPPEFDRWVRDRLFEPT